MNLAFSRDASLLLSIGFDPTYSIQVTNWKTEEIVCIRNSGPYLILDVVFDPYNKY